MTDQDEFLTGAEFAALAKVTIRAVRRWATKGIGPAPVRPQGSGLVRYKSSDVHAWLTGEPVGCGDRRLQNLPRGA